jgi:hypothetical protein
MVLFLASPHASAITGQTIAIAIDGGSTPGIFSADNVVMKSAARVRLEAV